jgi:DNA polymerase (family X)
MVQAIDSDQANSGQVLSNADVARRFVELADRLEILGENAFKVRAYRNAAKTLEELPEQIAVVAAEDRLGDLAGFGEAIQAKTKDVLATGTTKALEDARRKLPATLLELVGLPGVGAKTIYQLYTLAGVDSLSSLEAAIEAQKLRSLPRMSEKTEVKLKDALERHHRYSQRMLLSDARELGEKLMSALSSRPEVDRMAQAGSARRGVETVGDIDIVGASSDPAATMAAFFKLPLVTKVLASGHKTTRVILSNGFEADLKLANLEQFGTLLHHFTGSRAHNIKLREVAERIGLKINEYGVFDASGRNVIAGSDELAVYGALGMEAIPPELREDRGEIEAALAGALPALVQLSDIRGDVHAHTSATDGKATIEEMARAAMARGYAYMAITDHSQSLTVANGLTVERLRAQVKEVREVSERLGFPIFAGSECDIKPDGTMDFPGEALAELDIVIASVHSRFRQTAEEMTARLVRAIENPHVDLIAHPTGRLINQRDPYAVDMQAVIRAAARTGTALEINSFPERQDLSDVHARMAKEQGVRMAINTDAHAPEHYALIEYGINVARRGWLEKKDVVNASTLDEFGAWLKR